MYIKEFGASDTTKWDKAQLPGSKQLQSFRFTACWTIDYGESFCQIAEWP